MRLVAIAGLLLAGSFVFAETKTESANSPASGSAAAKRVLVVVNEKPITEGDLEFFLLSRNVAEAERSQLRQKFLEQLVERRLIQGYLAERKVQADGRELDAQVARLKRLISKSGQDPQKILGSLGYDDKKIREELSLPLAWQAYLSRVLTPESVREFFQSHRSEFDGTEVRASQIFLKLNEPGNEAERKAALEKLQQIRSEITSGQITFAEAAHKYSESPSREMGGDVGFFAYKGKMPLSFTQVVFPLKVGDVSEPFISPFGAHLAKVTERKEGTQSLEDVRPQVLTKMSGKMWNETVAQQRGKAKIEWVGEKKDGNG